MKVYKFGLLITHLVTGLLIMLYFKMLLSAIIFVIILLKNSDMYIIFHTFRLKNLIVRKKFTKKLCIIMFITIVTSLRWYLSYIMECFYLNNNGPRLRPYTTVDTRPTLTYVFVPRYALRQIRFKSMITTILCKLSIWLIL